MAVYLSPGVFPREIDLSAIPSSGSGIIPAFIGTAKKGPVGTPTSIVNAADFINTYGEPFVDSNLGYAVLTYMEEGNLAWVMRVGVECALGQATELAEVCIDTTGSRGAGWGRVPLYSGIDFGRIVLRTPSAASPYVFHDSSTTTPEYTDIDISSTDGSTDASMALTGDYSGSLDDSFTVLVTSPPDVGEVITGAGIDVIRQSDGDVITQATLNDSGGGVSDAVAIGTGLDASGLSLIITVVGASPLEMDDTFTFSAAPDNRNVQFEVEGVADLMLVMPSATYTDPDDFVTAFNLLITGSSDYSATNIDGLVEIRTDTAGERIQLVGNSSGTDPETEGWALEVGTTKWKYDIPRSYLVSNDTGPYVITTQNDRVSFLIINSTENVELEVTVPTSLSMPVTTLASHIHLGGVKSGARYYESFAIQVNDVESALVIVATATNQFDQVELRANFSYIESLRFADEVEIPFPYTRAYRPFSDPRVLEPAGGVNDPEIPLSCEEDPSGSDCTEDTAYFANVVGFIVAKSAGTWIDDARFTLENFNGVAGRWTIIITDVNGNVLDRTDDLSFDDADERYIGNVVNEGSAIGGENGNAFYQWVERDSDIGADEVRLPGDLNEVVFVGGENGIPADAAFSAALDSAIIGNQLLGTGLYAFDNPETIDISLLAVPGNSSGSVIGTALQICERRGDCLFIVDPPFGLKPQQVVDWHNGMLSSSDLSSAINSSYGALYWGWLKIFDQFSSQELFVPPSGHTLAVFARTERETESWFAPAGLNRGRLLTALDTEYVPTRGDRDLLYGFNNAVNPIAKFPQEGLVVWGQRTLQRKDSALDRVNVRMLLIHLKKVLIPLLRNFLFEQNDEFLWAQVRGSINPVLADIAGRRGLTAYQVICDETNNTPATIDRNELHVSVLIKPTRVVEFIQLDLAILRSDALFSSEAVLRAAGVVGV